MSETTAAGGESAAPTSGTSIEDELGEVFDGLIAEREPETFLLPGWREKLQVKYRVLEQDEADKIGEKIAEQVRSGDVDNVPLMALVDGLIASCVGFYTEVDGEVVALNEAISEPTDKPIRWDRSLAEVFSKRLEKVFGIDNVTKLTARQIVHGVLGNDDRLVQRHGREVNRWSERELEAIHTDF